MTICVNGILFNQNPLYRGQTLLLEKHKSCRKNCSQSTIKLTLEFRGFKGLCLRRLWRACLMLQHEEMMIRLATGETHTVKEFCKSFEYVNLDWENMYKRLKSTLDQMK